MPSRTASCSTLKRLPKARSELMHSQSELIELKLMKASRCSDMRTGEWGTCVFRTDESLLLTTGIPWRSVQRLSWWVSLLMVSQRIGRWRAFAAFRRQMISAPTLRTMRRHAESRFPRASGNRCLPLVFTASPTEPAARTPLSLIRETGKKTRGHIF